MRRGPSPMPASSRSSAACRPRPPRLARSAAIAWCRAAKPLGGGQVIVIDHAPRRADRRLRPAQGRPGARLLIQRGRQPKRACPGEQGTRIADGQQGEAQGQEAAGAAKPDPEEVVDCWRARSSGSSRPRAASGIVLIAAALVAFAWANSPWAELYGRMQHIEAGITLGALGLELSLAHWVNDGLMAIFFFVVGLEIKRELLVGELAGWQRAALPMVGALGGMVVPARSTPGSTWASPRSPAGACRWRPTSPSRSASWRCSARASRWRSRSSSWRSPSSTTSAPCW